MQHKLRGMLKSIDLAVPRCCTALLLMIKRKRRFSPLQSFYYSHSHHSLAVTVSFAEAVRRSAKTGSTQSLVDTTAQPHTFRQAHEPCLWRFMLAT